MRVRFAIAICIAILPETSGCNRQTADQSSSAAIAAPLQD